MLVVRLILTGHPYLNPINTHRGRAEMGIEFVDIRQPVKVNRTTDLCHDVRYSILCTMVQINKIIELS